MKETGIIMSGNHPTLILDETKTQTRRTWGLEKINQHPDKWKYQGQNKFGEHLFYPVGDYPDEFDGLVKCPYGQVGDRLWVRETWGRYIEIPDKIIYKADTSLPVVEKWQSPRFMPRWASRILLENIINPFPQRLQDITEEDALAEGVKIMQGTWQKIDLENHKLIGEPQPYTARYHFEALWDFLNAKRGYGWEINPWVWVILFRLIKEGLATILPGGRLPEEEGAVR